MIFKFATVGLNNKIVFDGETEEIDVNRYWRNALYTPASGDRVLFLYDEVSKIKILQGRVVK